jgi:4-amino-4-deoxy-L-arabinose transferase-like glycosyltransferase
MSVSEITKKEAVNPTSPGINWSRIFLTIGILVALIIVICVYYLRTYNGLTEPGQMDLAQISRNISSGGQFTTRFIRPSNVAILGDASTSLPELNHGPLYPCAVAGVFKAKAASEQVLCWVSMFFFICTVLGTYFLGKSLFDWRTGIFAASALSLSQITLQIGTGANEWTMAAFWLVLLLLIVASHHRRSMDGRKGTLHAIAAGILISLLFMTHHVLIFLGIAVAFYFALTGSRSRLHFVLFMLTVLITSAPWAYRNASLTHGSILAANSWDVFADTNEYPGSVFYRSTDGAYGGLKEVLLFPLDHFASFAKKLITGISDTIKFLMPMLGLLILPLSVVCILYKFKSPSANAVRGLIYGLSVILFACIALFSMDNNSLILLAPIIAIFGSGYLFLLLDAKKLHPVFVKGMIIGVVAITFWPALTKIIWTVKEPDTTYEASAVLAQGDKLGVSCVYTDVPWLAAWRTVRMNAVWLPHSDKDITQLDMNGFHMYTIILTKNTRNIPADETWYKIYTSKLQRDYIADPDAVLKRVQEYAEKIGRTSDQSQAAKKFFRQSQRNMDVFQSVEGFVRSDLGPFTSEDTQVYQREGED